MKNAIKTFINLPKNAKNVAFLYSNSKNGWQKTLAWNPVEIFTYKTGQFKNPFKKLKRFIDKNTKLRRIIIGFVSYDIGYETYAIKKTAKDDLKLPDIYFLTYEKWRNFTDKKEKIHTKNNANHKNKNFKPEIKKSQYKKSYEKIKKYIYEGDIYQINLTYRLKAETNIPARELFLKIIEKNPVDYLAYIEGDGFEILSASPERFIKIENKKIETCPVKGTKPRGQTKREDLKFKKQLIENEKEAAELNMITDLLRNDLGKICKIGSVKMEGHRLISECPTVWHTYSKITGKIDNKYPNIKALISMLPGGSITGCPKKRAMEIIDELEPTTRSVYAGVIGYIKPNENLDFNIAIRTIIKKKEKLYLQVGGGIVLDSTNQDEYEETLHKAKSFMKILC